MITYEEIKNWFEQKENKDRLVLGVSFVLTFVVGFGAGKYQQQSRRDTYKPQSNYTTQASKKPFSPTTNQNQPAAQTKAQGQGTVAGAQTSQSKTCPIKGNISTNGKKIYHMPGGAFYNIVKPEQCF